MISLVITGGGTAAIGKLLCKGGASKWFRDAYVPYSTDSTDKFLGYTPKKYVSKETALRLATRAAMRSNDTVISCTAKLMSPDKPLYHADGSKRISCAYLAIHNNLFSGFKYVELLAETREEQEEELANIIVDLVINRASWLLDDVCFATELVDPAPFIRQSNIIFPGSFNPVTDNHLHIAELVEKKYIAAADREIGASASEVDGHRPRAM